MTDRDDSAKGFLERWSRKKIDAERETSAPAKADATDASPAAEVRLPEREAKNDTKNPDEATPKPEFDLASLPSLDSITAITDIRAFLTPGVPADIARAALRRAWATDPAIRDFKGLAENDWDFTDPTAMPGFGALPEGTDITKLVGQIFGDEEKPTDADVGAGQPADPQPPQIAKEITAPNSQADVVSPEGEPPQSAPQNTLVSERQVAQNDFVQRDNNIASHNSISGDESEEHTRRRQHGTALPQ